MKDYNIKVRFFSRYFSLFIICLMINWLMTDALFAHSRKKDLHDKQAQVATVAPTAVTPGAAALPAGSLPVGCEMSSYHQQVYGGSGLGSLFSGLGVHGQDSPEVSRLVKEAEQTAEQLEVDIDHKVSILQRNAAMSVAQMRVDAENRSVRIKQEAEEQTVRLRQQADKHAVHIQKKVEQEALDLKKNAASKVILIINQADEEALKLRKKAREEAILKPGRVTSGPEFAAPLLISQPALDQGVMVGEVGQKTPLTREWKEIVWREFNADSALMKKIIMDGEDQSQLPDYLKRFTEQNYWFDKALTDTRHVGDPNYSLLINKKVKVGSVVNAQRKADAFLIQIAKHLKLNMPDFKKARLFVLYELNAFAQKAPILSVSDENKPKVFVFNDQLIRYFVLKIVNEITGKATIFSPKFKVLDDKEVQLLSRGTSTIDLEKEVAQLKKALAQKTDEKDALHELAKKKLEVAHSTCIDFEMQLKSTGNDLDRYKNATQKLLSQKGRLITQVESLGKDIYEHELQFRSITSDLDLTRREAKQGYDVRDVFKKDMAVRLEAKEKDCLDLKLLLTGVQQKVDVLDKQLIQARENIEKSKMELELARGETTTVRTQVDTLKKEVQANKKMRKHFETRANLVEEVSDIQAAEYKKKVHVRISNVTQLERIIKEKEEQLVQAEKKLKEKENLFVQKDEKLKEQEKTLDVLQENVSNDKQRLASATQEARAIDATPPDGQAGDMLTSAGDTLKVRRELQETENKKLLEQELEHKTRAPTVGEPVKG